MLDNVSFRQFGTSDGIPLPQASKSSCCLDVHSEYLCPSTGTVRHVLSWLAYAFPVVMMYSTLNRLMTCGRFFIVCSLQKKTPESLDSGVLEKRLEAASVQRPLPGKRVRNATLRSSQPVRRLRPCFFSPLDQPPCQRSDSMKR